ncbi:MAG: LPS export ABC transporter periplasmic protein LptC [Gammaproteobacteria bacterium]|nr:LPS export ABC transporter periplasmic protein LptC [Gammaproteobacteria bacterium]
MKWVYVVLIGVLAVVFIYLINTDEAPALNPFPQALSDEPDALLTGFEVTQFDTEGTQLYRISATEATFYERLERTNILGLHMMVYSEGRDDWRLRADEGTYEERLTDPLLTLSGNVLLSSVGEVQSTVVVTTESLNIYPRRQFAESMSRVIVENEGSKFHADQFEVDLATKDVRFSSASDSKVELLVSPSS